MKNFNIALLAILALVFVSCSDDDEDHNHDLSGKGKVSFTFDNGYGDDAIVLDAANTANANGEKLKITKLSYIVSNFVLIAEDGTEYTYPKDDSYFIINEEEAMNDIDLSDIPAGEYKAIKFGVGVDQEKYKQGADGQGDFWTEASENDLTWSWTAGYVFLKLEGTYTSATVTDATDYRIHMGSRGTIVDNYKEVILDLPTNIKVSDAMDAAVHLKVDASKIVVGENSIKLEDGATIMGGDKSTLVAENASEMFMVHHVHNGGGH